MELLDPNTRFEVCFNLDCKIFIPIFPCEPANITELKIFKRIHNGHMVQIVNYNEIPNDYIYVRTGKAKEETLNQIQEMLKV